MTTFDVVKKLADNQKISIVELEEKLNFSRNSLYAWKKSKPSIDKLEAVANYFGVSTDYLLGRSTNNTNNFDDNSEDEFATFFRINTEDMPQEDKEKLQEELKEYFEFMKNRLKNK